MSEKLRVGILGGTGMVGQRFISLLENHPWFEVVTIAASPRSAGKTYEEAVGGRWKMTTPMPEAVKNIVVMNVNEVEKVAATVDFVFSAVDMSKDEIKAIEEEYAKTETPVVSNNSAHRWTPDVPMVVPEVNPEALKDHKGLIANPNCSTILLVSALYPLYKKSKVKRVIVSTYQAVSGAGKEAIDELTLQVKQTLNGEEIKPEIFQHQIAFNLIPHIDVWMDDDYTKEEMKLVYETHKILNDDSISITPTAVRVPVYRSHSESVYVETEETITPEEARELLAAAPGIIIQDDPHNNVYPMPLFTSDTDEVYVGRIRRDLGCDTALNMWITFDQIRKGAATNAVQIAEYLVSQGVVK